MMGSRLNIALMVLLGTALLVSVPGTTTRSVAKPPTSQRSQALPLEIELPKGKHFFTALASTRAREVVPLNGFLCRENYKLAFTFHPADLIDGQRTWRHDERTQPTASHNGRTTWAKVSFDDSCPADAPFKELDPQLEDVSEMAAINGAQIYRIPYAIVGEDTRFILVVVADKTDIFGQLFKVPEGKQYEHIKWDNEGTAP